MAIDFFIPTRIVTRLTTYYGIVFLQLSEDLKFLSKHHDGSITVSIVHPYALKLHLDSECLPYGAPGRGVQLHR